MSGPVYLVLMVLDLVLMVAALAGTKYLPGKYQTMSFWAAVTAFVLAFVLAAKEASVTDGTRSFWPFFWFIWGIVTVELIVLLNLPEKND